MGYLKCSFYTIDCDTLQSVKRYGYVDLDESEVLRGNIPHKVVHTNDEDYYVVEAAITYETKAWQVFKQTNTGYEFVGAATSEVGARAIANAAKPTAFYNNTFIKFSPLKQKPL